MASILTLKEKISLRKIYNLEILKELSSILEKNPNLRFGQALIVLGICKDESELWSEESIDTYSKIKLDK